MTVITIDENILWGIAFGTVAVAYAWVLTRNYYRSHPMGNLRRWIVGYADVATKEELQYRKEFVINHLTKLFDDSFQQYKAEGDPLLE
jgi:hypothetical protein